MIIAALTDLHGDISPLGKIAHDLECADLVLITGDLTHFGRRPEVEHVVKAVRNINPNLLAVPGNCDYAEVAAFLTEEGINLDRAVKEFAGVTFLGIGGSLPCPGTTPNEMTEEEMSGCLKTLAPALDRDTPLVVVAHQPPHGTKADLLKSGIHVGSTSLRAFIEERAPLVCFTGHIHEGRTIDAIGPTKVANPGPLGYGHYTMAEISDRVERLEIRG